MKRRQGLCGFMAILFAFLVVCPQETHAIETPESLLETIENAAEGLLIAADNGLVKEKLDNIYKDVEWDTRIDEEMGHFFALDAENNLCLVYVVSVEFMNSEPAGGEFGTVEQVEIVIMEK